MLSEERGILSPVRLPIPPLQRSLSSNYSFLAPTAFLTNQLQAWPVHENCPFLRYSNTKTKACRSFSDRGWEDRTSFYYGFREKNESAGFYPESFHHRSQSIVVLAQSSHEYHFSCAAHSCSTAGNCPSYSRSQAASDSTRYFSCAGCS